MTKHANKHDFSNVNNITITELLLKLFPLQIEKLWQLILRHNNFHFLQKKEHIQAVIIC
jgi:hypothetical protein